MRTWPENRPFYVMSLRLRSVAAAAKSQQQTRYADLKHSHRDDLSI